VESAIPIMNLPSKCNPLFPELTEDFKEEIEGH